MGHTHRHWQKTVTRCLDCDEIAEIIYECACYEKKVKIVACKCERK